MDAVTRKAIARDSRKRYGSVTELQADVKRYLAGRTTSAERPSLIRKGRLFIRRNKTPFAIATVSLLILTVSGLLFLNNLKRKELETQRARELSSYLSLEIDDLSAEYHTLVSETAEPARELSNELLITAVRKKNESVFKNPKVPFLEVNELIRRALVLDPDSSEARFQLFSNQCIMLNFAEALKNPPDPSHKNAGYMKVVRAFPEFDFSEEKRPSVKELTRFFREAPVIETNHIPLMTAILVYDADCREDRAGYAEVVGAALGRLWPQHGEVATEYFPDSDKLVIRSSRGAFTGTGRVRGSDFMLRMLDVDQLVLQVEGRFDLNCLKSATIRRLDLSGMSRPILGRQLIINGLKEVTIRRDQAKEGWLKKLLTSDGLSRPKVIISDK